MMKININYINILKKAVFDLYYECLPISSMWNFKGSDIFWDWIDNNYLLYIFVRLFVCLSVCLFVCLFVPYRFAQLWRYKIKKGTVGFISSRRRFLAGSRPPGWYPLPPRGQKQIILMFSGWKSWNFDFLASQKVLRIFFWIFSYPICQNTGIFNILVFIWHGQRRVPHASKNIFFNFSTY